LITEHGPSFHGFPTLFELFDDRFACLFMALSRTRRSRTRNDTQATVRTRESADYLKTVSDGEKVPIDRQVYNQWVAEFRFANCPSLNPVRAGHPQLPPLRPAVNVSKF
jgi:hypothetical protein